MAKALASLNKKRKSISFLPKPKILHFGRQDVLLRRDSTNSNRRVNVKTVKQKKMGKTSRVVVCGMAGVGKTAILEQLIFGNITPSTESYPTIEDIYVANVETERGTREKMRLYDTAGLPPLSGPNASSNAFQQQQQQQLAKQLLGLTEGYVLIYDPAKPESFECLLPLKRDIDKNRDKKEVATIVLANRIRVFNSSFTGSGNETPPPANLTAAATLNKANTWALKEHIKHFEVNAMERASLLEPFVYLATKLNPPQNKSSFPQLSMVRKSISNRPEAAQ
ncbi:NF-kappa-B inhibitor-interacting Ras-like protein isoform X1 [Frankliniella occidentalis]|uniref:NF-kappa-B inhibitor-interacting Ras-like protein isoform X1 n=2 Tax=Frankliniella occidentalis TaxID=133901 RepID=A0A6J1RSS3_FRAOC|nr:NF-kappa-B inhibitor-interacting Ras-like protein isoform X1 [Frankliniella occidentalis]